MATVALAFPFLPLKARRALRSRWSRQLLDALGVRLQVAGTPPASGLLVANHISWLDVYAINAATPTAFVSKDDVRAWPVVGWLSARTETIFLERGSRSAAMRAKQRVTAELRQRACVSVFPEGTTSDGDGLLPFHSALFQSAIDTGIRVAPVALRYTGRDGEPSPAPVYIGDTSLWHCLRTIVATGGLTANLCFLPALDPAGMHRRQLAEQARQLIASRLTQPANPSRSSPDAADSWLAPGLTPASDGCPDPCFETGGGQPAARAL